MEEIDRVGRRAAESLTSDVNGRVDVEAALRRLHGAEPDGAVDSHADRFSRPRFGVRLVGVVAAVAVVIAGAFALIRHDPSPRIVSSDTVVTTPAANTTTTPSAEAPPTSLPDATSTTSSASTTSFAPANPATAPSWELLPASPLAPRTGHSVVWTGSDVIVWGGAGVDGDWTEYGDGAAFNPATGRWRSIAPAPIAGRIAHSAVWTGSEMIVWGGMVDAGCGTADAGGAAYDPRTDSWRVIATSAAGARSGHSALWTGSRMIVVGGSPSSGTRVDGGNLCNPPSPSAVPLGAAAYDPTTDSWTDLAAPPWSSGDLVGAAVWDGKEVLIWGGQNVGDDQGTRPWLGTGFAYDPAADQWSELPEAPLTARDRFVSAWTGTELIVVGGQDNTGYSRSDAAAYDPGTQQWRLLADSPGAQSSASAVWTGDELVMVGGCCAQTMNAMSYDPVADEWTPLPDLPFEGCELKYCSRYGPAPIWTGTTAIIWGGSEERSVGEEMDSLLRSDGAGLLLGR